MILTKEETLTRIIEEAVRKALTVEMVYEKVRDEKTGQPLAVKKTVTEDSFIPSVIVQMLPFYEGVMRGFQEDINKTNNKISEFDEKINVIGNILLQTENSLKCLASLSDNIKKITADSEADIYLEESTNVESNSK